MQIIPAPRNNCLKHGVICWLLQMRLHLNFKKIVCLNLHVFLFFYYYYCFIGLSPRTWVYSLQIVAHFGALISYTHSFTDKAFQYLDNLQTINYTWCICTSSCENRIIHIIFIIIYFRCWNQRKHYILLLLQNSFFEIILKYNYFVEKLKFAILIYFKWPLRGLENAWWDTTNWIYFDWIREAKRVNSEVTEPGKRDINIGEGLAGLPFHW